MEDVVVDISSARGYEGTWVVKSALVLTEAVFALQRLLPNLAHELIAARRRPKVINRIFLAQVR